LADRLALEAWADWMKSQKDDVPPLAEEFLEELRRIAKSQPGDPCWESGDLDEDDEDGEEDAEEAEDEEVDQDDQAGAAKPGLILRTVTEALGFLDYFDGYRMVATDEDLQVEGIRQRYGHLLLDDYRKDRGEV
jgi:hypothetical protein